MGDIFPISLRSLAKKIDKIHVHIKADESQYKNRAYSMYKLARDLKVGLLSAFLCSTNRFELKHRFWIKHDFHVRKNDYHYRKLHVRKYVIRAE